MRTKMRKERPNTGLQHVHLLYDNAAVHKPSTVAQFMKPEKVNVLLHSPYSPDLALCDISSFRSRKKKKEQKQIIHLVGDIGPEVHWGL